jgi:hypothetical protein
MRQSQLPKFGVAICLVLVLVCCSGMGKPSESDAKAALQQWLDEKNAGVWRVDRVEKSNGRDAQVDGTPAYIMQGVVHVTLLQDKKSFNMFELLGPTIWLADIGGKAGDAKQTRPLSITWLKTDNGWKLASAECISC